MKKYSIKYSREPKDIKHPTTWMYVDNHYLIIIHEIRTVKDEWVRTDTIKISYSKFLKKEGE